jgi:serine/threonine protein kinase, bacterial
MWKQLCAWWNLNVRDRPYKPGTLVGSYRIEEVLGMGSYGIAYRAVHLPSGRVVVIKQVKPSLRRSPKGEAMQHYEQRVLAALSHPQIPRWLESFRHGNDSFLVMSYIAGPTLEELLFEEGTALSEWEAARLMRQVGELVAYLHEKNVIHRDIRIPNVIWQEGRLHLIDFGLARFRGDPPTYIAQDLSDYPEEKQLKRQVEPTSDLYALGHFFLFLLYSGYRADENQPERSWEEELTLSPQIREMIRRLLQIDPAYDSVEEWLADLDGYLNVKKEQSNR